MRNLLLAIFAGVIFMVVMIAYMPVLVWLNNHVPVIAPLTTAAMLCLAMLVGELATRLAVQLLPTKRTIVGSSAQVEFVQPSREITVGTVFDREHFDPFRWP